MNKSSEGPIVRNSDPQIGFKVCFSEKLGLLNVKVIGAKQLPTDYGTSKARGYVVKVTFLFKF